MRSTLLSVAACALVAGSASAAIVGTSGAATQIARPADAQLNALTSSTVIYAWDEAQNVALDRDVTVDAVAPGTYDQSSDLGSFVLAAGTLVSSHYIHFDSPSSTNASASGSVRFNQDIIGVIVRNDVGFRRLDLSDFLGLGTLFTANVNARGLELNANGDGFGISLSARRIEFTLRITNPGDFIRVLTVPAPGAAAMLGLAGLTALRRRR
jgi:hypothetical protein